MELKTQFSLGEKVFFIEKDKILRGKVCGLEVKLGHFYSYNSQVENYSVKAKETLISSPEVFFPSEVFKTKEQLEEFVRIKELKKREELRQKEIRDYLLAKKTIGEFEKKYGT